MKALSFLAFLSVTLLGCSGCVPGEVEVPEASEEEISLVTWDSCGYEEESHMCDFTLEDQNGDEFNLYDHIGRPIVLDYSTMWCGYCQVAAQDVAEAEQDHADIDLLYITVLIETPSGAPPSIEDCENWASVFGIINSPVLAGNRDLIDPSAVSGVPVSGWPTFLFLDEEMVIKGELRGYSKEALNYKIQTLLMD